MKSLIIICIIMLLFASYSSANNIQTTTPTLLNQNTINQTTQVQFSVSWDNSFRDVINRDAAWIFVKYKVGANGQWKHATIFGSNAPAGATIDVSSDFKGAFIYRTAQGSGSVNYTNVQLTWYYGYDGVNNNAAVVVKVFAIEMVYIPQGSFWLGDGTPNNVAGQFSQGTTTSPYQISSENSITLGGASGLGNRNRVGESNTDDFSNTITQTLPAAFPKGYNAFYVMKYEISQQQYVDYLNTLTRSQQQNAVWSNISTDIITNNFVMNNSTVPIFRNYIGCPTSGNGTSSPITFFMIYVRNDRACNYIDWNMGLLYADWAALRPFTELEFEKICRGDQNPVIDEFAWGTTNITAATTISGSENGTETITNANANADYGNINYTGGDGGQGPLRCGIFAKTGNTREQSGASYYGVMDLSGGLYEQCVSVGDVNSRNFDGSHGDGDLTTIPLNWNSNNASFRGGFLVHTLAQAQNLRVSDRSAADINGPNGQNIGYGFRTARTAPVGTFNAPNINEKKKD